MFPRLPEWSYDKEAGRSRTRNPAPEGSARQMEAAGSRYWRQASAKRKRLEAGTEDKCPPPGSRLEAGRRREASAVLEQGHAGRIPVPGCGI